MTFIEYLKTGQLYQFIFTLLIIVAYVFSMVRGTPDETLKSILLVVVSYWFVSTITKPTVDNLTNKVQELHDTVKANEISNSL